MRKFLLIFFSIVLISKSLAQSNNPAPYCVANYSTGCAERWIAGVVTAGASTNITHYSNGCGPFTDGYQYYCNHMIVTGPGQNITFSIIPGGFLYNYGIKVFIDWDGDNIFAVPGEQFLATGLVSSNSTFTCAVSVPTAQPVGKVRLRVRLEQWGSVTGPCNTLMRGETEDYDVYVGMNPPAASQFTASVSNNGPLCVGQTLSLTTNHNSIFSPVFNWGGPSSFTSNIQNPVIVNTSTLNHGQYTLTITSGTCPYTLMNFATVNAYPVVTAASKTICAGNSATLTASGANTWSWSTGSNTFSTSVTPSVSSIYTVTGSNFNCSTSQTVGVNISPEFTVSSSNATICAGDQATLTVSGAISYTWSNNSNATSISVSPSITTVYTITAATGTCTASKIITQYVAPCTNIKENENNEVKIMVYPNPFKDELVISVNGKHEILIHDVSGRLILKQMITGVQNIRVENLCRGIYFIRLNEANSKPIKILKN